MTMNVQCPVCLGGEFEDLIDFGVIPRSGSFLPSPGTAFRTMHHAFEFCTHCALTRQRGQADDSPDYRNVNRSTRRQMPVYTPNLVSSLSRHHPDRNDLVVDVGGNDGAFLDLVAEAGYANRLNIEPSVPLAELSAKAGHKVETVHLDSTEANRIRKQYGPAGGIFCRHVLEHVPDPFGLLSAMRLMLKEDGILFVEIPDARGILHRLLGHELWDEHLFHFTVENLGRLVKRTGFLLEEETIQPHRGGTNILFRARMDFQQKSSSFPEKAVFSDVEACRCFKTRWMDLRLRIQSEMKGWAEPVACLGASHPQSNYILFTEIGGHVDFLVDDDPHKVGCYVPLPQPVPVVSTAQLFDGPPPGTIIRTAFGCEAWMDGICLPLAARGARIVEPYLTSNPRLYRPE